METICKLREPEIETEMCSSWKTVDIGLWWVAWKADYVHKEKWAVRWRSGSQTSSNSSNLCTVNNKRLGKLRDIATPVHLNKEFNGYTKTIHWSIKFKYKSKRNECCDSQVIRTIDNTCSCYYILDSVGLVDRDHLGNWSMMQWHI